MAMTILDVINDKVVFGKYFQGTVGIVGGSIWPPCSACRACTGHLERHRTGSFLTNALPRQKSRFLRDCCLLTLRLISASPAKVILTSCSENLPACPLASFDRPLGHKSVFQGFMR